MERLNEKTLAALGPAPAQNNGAPAASALPANPLGQSNPAKPRVQSAPAKGGLPEVVYEGTPDNIAASRPQAPVQSAPLSAAPVSIPARPSRGANINLGGGGGGAFDPVTGGIALGLAALAAASRRRKNAAKKA
jgi:hypothetical protein